MRQQNNINKIQQFLKWWKTGLTYFIPNEWKEYIWPTPDKIYVSTEGEDILLSLISQSKRHESEEKRFRISDKLNIEKTLTKWTSSNQKYIFYGLIQKPDVLTRPIVLPTNATTNINEILSFELERKTPFKKTQVYYDYFLTDDINESQINITLFISTREKVKPFLSTLKDIGIKLNILTHDPKLPINLLASESDTIKPSQYDRHLTFTGIVFLICCLTALYIPLFKMDKDIQTLKTKLVQLKKEAIILAEEENLLKSNEHKQNFLAQKKKQQIDELLIIKTLTELLPEDTYLTRYIHKQGELQLQGESSSASELIEKIENSEHFYNTQFRSAITKNSKNNKERFHIISRTKNISPIDNDA